MPVQIDYVAPTTGAAAKYHVVRVASLDYSNAKLTTQISSYVDKSTYTAQKQPVFIQTIEWPTLPDVGADLVGEIEKRLVAPTSDTSSPSASRASFAGGTIVDSAVASSTTDPATETSATTAPTDTPTETDSSTEKQATA